MQINKYYNILKNIDLGKCEFYIHSWFIYHIYIKNINVKVYQVYKLNIYCVL